MNLYAQYLKEREGKEVIEKGTGFCIYEIHSPHVYISDVFVQKEYRNFGIASSLIEEVVQKAKKENCKYALTSFCLKANGWNISRKVMKKLGFKFYRKDKNTKMIYTIMEI